jgi:hypothetical protein
MCPLRKTNLAALLLAIWYSTVIIYGCKNLYADEKEIPIEGAVYHVHRPDGSHKTYLDVVVGRSFSGKLPDDIDSIILLFKLVLGFGSSIRSNNVLEK